MAWIEWISLLDEVSGLESGVDISLMVLYFVVSNFVREVFGFFSGSQIGRPSLWFKLSGVGEFTKAFLVKQAMRGYRRVILVARCLSLF